MVPPHFFFKYNDVFEVMYLKALKKVEYDKK